MECGICGEPYGSCDECKEEAVHRALQAAANGIRPANKPKPRYWLGSAIDDCQLCGRIIGKAFVDGATHGGPWAIMCKPCHKGNGRGLGMGRGQEYTRITKGCSSPGQCEKIAHLPFASMQTVQTLACSDGCELVGRWLKTGG